MFLESNPCIRLDFKDAPQAQVADLEAERPDAERWQDESAIWAYLDGSEGFVPSAATESIWRELNRCVDALPLAECPNN